jgi:hypothetical protein
MQGAKSSKPSIKLECQLLARNKERTRQKSQSNSLFQLISTAFCFPKGTSLQAGKNLLRSGDSDFRGFILNIKVLDLSVLNDDSEALGAAVSEKTSGIKVKSERLDELTYICRSVK